MYDPDRRFFDLLSTDEIVILLSFDPTYRLPSCSINRRARMNAALQAIKSEMEKQTALYPLALRISKRIVA